MRSDSPTEAVTDDIDDEVNEFLEQFLNLYSEDLKEILELSEILQKSR